MNIGARFSDTDNVTYHSIRHPVELVWQDKSHFSPKEVVLPITQTLFHFDNLELRESKVEAKPTLLFLRSCDIHALRRLDQVYLKNGQNSDVYYARLRSKLKLVLLECRESFENCFCVAMGSNETRDYAAAIRLSDEGARIEVKDPELLGYFAELGEQDDFTPEFVQSNPVKVRTPDSVCDDPRRIRQILTAHPVWAEYDSRCIGCAAPPPARPAAATACTTSPMRRTPSRVSAVASGPAAWWMASATWPVATVFVPSMENACVIAPCTKSTTTRPVRERSTCASAALLRRSLPALHLL